MANFAASVLALGQAKFTNQFIGLGEWRKEDVAAIQVMEKGAIANPLLRDIRTSEQRTVEAYMPIRQASTGGTKRVYNHTGNFGDSLKQALAWGTLSETFKVSAKLADNNVLVAADMFAADLRNAIDNLLLRSNALLIASLVADKTEENAGGANGTFNATSHNYEIPNSQNDFFYQEVQAMMRKNRYVTPLISIADSKALVNAQRLGWQGQANAQNLNPQFAGQTIVGTNEDIITGQSGSVLTFASGAVAYMPWIPSKNRKALDPNKILDNVGDFGQISVPELGVDFAIHAYSQRADTESVGGDSQDVVTEFEVSIDWAYASTPISRANETSVFASVLMS
jgi:hypothetical protein